MEIIILLVLFAIILVVFWIYYIRLQDKYIVLQKKKDQSIDDARRQAKHIIEEAYRLNTETKKDLSFSLRSAITTLAGQIRSAAHDEVNQFRKALETEAQVSKVSLSRTVAGEHDQILVDMENYKKAKMTEIDVNARKVLKDFLHQTVGETIDLKAHEELVIKALEDAKRQNNF